MPDRPLPLTVPTLKGRVPYEVDRAIALIVDAVNRLGTPEVSPPLPIPTYGEIAQALSAGGESPLSLSGLTGQAATLQLAGVPLVTTLPDPLHAQDGQLVNFNGILYWFDGAARLWRVMGAAAVVIEDTHANRLLTYPPGAYPIGTLFFENDRWALYRVALDSSIPPVRVWKLLWALFKGSTAGRPADLTSNDGYFFYWDTEAGVLYRWTGSVWGAMSGILRGTYATRPVIVGGYPAAGVLYNAYDRGGHTWRSDGTNWVLLLGVGGPDGGTINPDQKPAGLGALDSGYLFWSSDYNRIYRWNGAVWQDAPDAPTRYQIAFFPLQPDLLAGWFPCDGAVVSRSTTSGGVVNYTTPDLISANRFPRGAAVAGGTGGAATHLHSVDPPSTATSGPSATELVLAGATTVASDVHTHTVDIAAFNSASASSLPPYLDLLPYIRL